MKKVFLFLGSFATVMKITGFAIVIAFAVLYLRYVSPKLYTGIIVGVVIYFLGRIFEVIKKSIT